MNLREGLQVECYSVYTYAERPKSFVYENNDYKVKEVKEEWLEPGERHFRIITEDSKFFELCYNYGKNEWSLGKGC